MRCYDTVMHAITPSHTHPADVAAMVFGGGLFLPQALRVTQSHMLHHTFRLITPASTGLGGLVMARVGECMGDCLQCVQLVMIGVPKCVPSTVVSTGFTLLCRVESSHMMSQNVELVDRLQRAGFCIRESSLLLWLCYTSVLLVVVPVSSESIQSCHD
jgi:hypothetical protein